MARYSIGFSRTTTASAAWQLELRTTSAKDARIWEIGLFCEPTAVATTLGLARVTGAGTGAATSLVPQAEDTSAGAAVITVVTAYATTSPAVASTTPLRRIALPATAGAGVIWQFPQGIVVPTNGSSTGGLAVWQYTTAAAPIGGYFVYEE